MGSVLTPTNLENSGEKKTQTNKTFCETASLSGYLFTFHFLIVVVIILLFSYKSAILIVDFYF